ncbi:MAG: copper resistance protein B [Vicinamibacterales bacterium]
MTRIHLALTLALLLAVAPPLEAQQAPATHQHEQPQAPASTASSDDHAQHQGPATPLPSFIPPVTDADRQAAFPDVHGHPAHDRSIHSFVLVDQLEWQTGTGTDAVSWDTKGWVGGDRHRFWFRSEGDRAGGRTEQAQTNLLYGRAISRWWDVIAGVRLDTLPDTPRTALALGVQGLAPYWFEVEASAYVEPAGRAHLRIEAEHDMLITNRLVLQPLVEFEVYGRADRERKIDAGLSTGEFGLRLRYVFRRELAPYVGVVWSRRFFGSASLARAAGEGVGGTRLAIGLRTWF